MRWWKTAEEMAIAFATKYPPQSDEEFLEECGSGDDPLAARIALAVRRSVAECGMIDPTHIRASHRYPGELEDLSGWGSPDFLDWVFRLEKDLGGGNFYPAVFESLPMPFSVRDLTAAAHSWRTLHPASLNR